MKTLIDLLERRVSALSQAPLYAFLDPACCVKEAFSYEEFMQKAALLGEVLKSRQLKGERALLLYPAGPDYVLSFFACLYAGIIAVPLYPPRRNRSMDRLLAVIADATPALILTTAAISNDIRSEFLSDGNGNITWIATDSIVAGESYTGWQPAGIEADDIAFLQYTSGSTGSPKGVMVTHRQLLENEEMIHVFADRRNAPVMINWLPLYHDMGLIGNLLYTLYAGGNAYLLSPFDFLQKPLRWLQAISTYRGTVSGGPNFAYEECVKRITEEQVMQLDLRSWRVAFNGAEPVNARTLERFSNMFRPAGFNRNSFMPCYGMAEATLIISGVKPEAPPALYEADAALLERHILQAPAHAGMPAVQLVSCGAVIGQEVVIVSDNTVLPEERVGEIWVKGNNVAKGYWGNEAATTATFRAFLPDGQGPFLRTGDLGFIKAGALYVTGRLKELIIIRGRNIYPQDVERMAGAAHQALETGAGAAFAITVDGQEKLVIVQELKREYSVHAPVEEIMPAMRSAVAAQYDLQPYAIVLIRKGSLLRTSSGKIQRNACRQAFLSGEGLAVVANWQETAVMPVIPDTTVNDIRREITYTSVLQRLKAVISTYAGIPVETVSEKDTFEQFGLDSAGAVYTATAMGEWLGIPVSPTLLYDYPGVSALAGFLHTAYAGGMQDMNVSIEGSNVNVHTPVAVIGIGCRFPGAAGVDGFWQLLQEGRSAVRKVDPERWALSAGDEGELGDMIRMGGFLADIDAFDATFFGIADEEAVMMDPQQRLLLEVSWEALEDAGIAPQSLAGKPVGVFTGISSGDYARLQVGAKALDGYHGTGNAGSIAANRLSYHYDLRGPSMAVDTACSSSLVAVHQACKSLQLQECSLAMAAGVNIMAAPDLSIIFARAGMLAPDGRCKTFDAAANGYVRGEGCGMVILKRLEDAERDGDRIYGVIRGSAVNQDGRSNGLTAPNGPAQEAVMKQALMAAGMRPGEVDLIEAHGTGTALGDPIEMKALLHTYGVNRDRPLYAGAVKTNIGHLEAAAGIAGLIKALLCLHHRTVVPHLHLHTLNSHIPALPVHCEIPRRLHPLPQEGTPAAGVSSFGFGGTNAHVVLQAYHNKQAATAASGPELLVVSAAQQERLVRQVQQLLNHLQANPQLSIKDLAGTLLQGRDRLPWCKAFVAGDVVTLKDKLEEYLSYATDPLIREEDAPRKAEPRLAFMFTGQGAQYREMGKALYEQEAVFRHTFDHCSEILAGHTGVSISHLLYHEKDDEQIHHTAITQPLLVAFEISLARLWASWGVMPDAVMGHSIGEIAAAHIAGVLSLEDALLLTAIRGKLMQQLPPGGQMWAISANAQVIEPVIRPLAAQVAVASFNAPEQIVISGDAQELAGPLQVFRDQGIRMVQLKVSHAFHSPLMEPAVAAFRDRISNIRFHMPRIPLLSNVSGQWAGPEICTPDYWAQHIVAPVRFSQGIQVMAASFDCCCEIGPHPVLTGLARQSGVADKMVLLPGIINKSDNRADMLRSLGELYCLGYPVRTGQLYPPHSFRRLSLPGYPFLKTRYWISTPTRVQAAADGMEQEWLYAKVWEAMPLQEIPASGRDDLLLICTDQLSLIQLLLSDSCPLRRPFRLLVPEALAGAEHTGRVLVFSPATWETLLQELGSSAPVRCTVLFAMGLETPSTDDINTIHTYLQTYCPLLLQALAGISKVPFGKGDCRILLFTPPVAPVLPEVAVAPQAAVLHGMLRCVQHEMPETQVCSITTDVYDADWWKTWLQTELDAPHMETEVAFRQGQRFVSRIKEQDRAAGKLPAFRCDAAQCWLLTGGNSEMSRSLIPWLLRKGARHFILAGRGAPKETQWQELQQAVAAAAGSIRWCQADISLEQDISLLHDCISATGRPLQGILHLAGVLQDKPVFNLSWADMEPVLAPKVRGTLHLHQLSRQLEPEYFICFSSLAGLLGAAYQANYAGANAFMDAFAYCRRSEGLPATSINWGPWAGAGMAATASSHQVAGVDVIRKTTAAGNIAMLEQVLAAGQSHAAVIDFNRTAARLLPQVPFFQYLLEKWAVAAQPAQDATSLMERLQAGSVEELTGKLVTLISREVKAVLGDRHTGVVGAEDTFFTLGMDSVMTVALQQRLHRYLQLNFSVAAIYNYNTIRALAAFLAEKAAPQKTAPAHLPARTPAARPQRMKKRDLAAMSEEEAATLLDNLLSLKNI